MKTKANYEILNQYKNNTSFDEDYALLSHYIQLQDSDEKKNYKKILEEKKVKISDIPGKEEFNKVLKVPFPNKDSKFTFIDLFAGIGGFRLAMQNLGGKCVFSSEWDDGAKQTYFENYGKFHLGILQRQKLKL